MAITALPTPPSRQDPTNFNDRADAFLGALPTFQAEANALQTDVNAKQVAAALSATNASTSATDANNTANTSIWVSGTTYAIGVNRFSPINFLTYRRKTAGAGTTDPSLDPTNWQLLTGQGNVTLDGTQTITGNKTLSGTTTVATLSMNTSGTGWTVLETANVLYFKFNGVNKAKLDSSGNFTVAGDIVAFGSV